MYLLLLVKVIVSILITSWVQTDYVRYRSGASDSKLQLYLHVDYLHSHVLKLLGLNKFHHI
jgi:hypothetical protein